MGFIGMTIEEITTGIKEGKFTAQEVVEETLRYIKDVEPTIDGFLMVCDGEALEQAKKIDEKVRNGERLGRLAGVPIAIKDNICTDGIPTTCGSKMLEGFIPPYDATVIKRLKIEDAIVIGKTNLDEFGMGSSTENSAFKITKNPWDTTKVPGGSSGGSAAVVSAGMVPLSLGSDTGGSVRQPASFCCVVGVKPTYGLVSRYGLVAFASSLDTIGPLGRNVRDCAIALEILQGSDPMDSTSCCTNYDHGKVKGYLDGIDEGIKGYKIGIPKHNSIKDADSDVATAFETSLGKLKELGATVEEIDLPMSQEVLSAYYVISSAEASSNLGRYDGIRYGYRSDTYDGVEDLIEKARTEAFGKEVKRRILMGTYALSSNHIDEYYHQALRIMKRVRREFKEIFKKYDLIVTPTSMSTAFDIGNKEKDPMATLMKDLYAVPVNLGRLPALSMPCGFSREGLPIGLQLVGDEFTEERLFKAAYALEKSLKIPRTQPSIIQLSKVTHDGGRER